MSAGEEEEVQGLRVVFEEADRRASGVGMFPVEIPEVRRVVEPQLLASLPGGGGGMERGRRNGMSRRRGGWSSYGKDEQETSECAIQFVG